VWSYPNLHGDVAATCNAAGVKQGATLAYDPYGTTLGTVVDNSNGNWDYGWEGQHTKGLEHATGVAPVIEMGARIYNPSLGRFQAQDPIEGGTPNDYTYPNDPINSSDLTGRCGFGNPWKKCGPGHKGCTSIVGCIAKKTGQTARFAVDAVMNPWSPYIALTSGGDCGVNWGHIMVVCTHAKRWYGGSGTTIGSVLITPYVPDSRMMDHESNHATQEMIPGFPILYFASGRGADNVWEYLAGLRDGCYAPDPGPVPYRPGCIHKP
jgi:RHS repeat-associated protein